MRLGNWKSENRNMNKDSLLVSQAKAGKIESNERLHGVPHEWRQERWTGSFLLWFCFKAGDETRELYIEDRKWVEICLPDSQTELPSSVSEQECLQVRQKER